MITPALSAQLTNARLPATLGRLLLAGRSIIRQKILRTMTDPTPTTDDRYIYAARLVRVVDGDTVILDIDLGCGTWLRGERCRLHAIDAPEKRGDDKQRGFEALRHLEKILENKRLLIRTHKDKKGKFGRWLVDLYVDGHNVNRRMVADGYAKPFGE